MRYKNFKIPDHERLSFHNLSRYNCHHLIQGFGKYKKEELRCRATSRTRYISVSLNRFRSKDYVLDPSIMIVINKRVARKVGFHLVERQIQNYSTVL